MHPSTIGVKLSPARHAGVFICTVSLTYWSYLKQSVTPAVR
jgi:hypothetical protein